MRFSKDLFITVSNADNCNLMKEYMSDLIEKIYNPGQMTVNVVVDDTSGDNVISGGRDELIAAMGNLECASDAIDETDYDDDLTLAFNSLVASSTADTQKVLMISFCETEDGNDNTCNVPALIDPERLVEITIVNAGAEVSINDQFACIVPGGTASPN